MGTPVIDAAAPRAAGGVTPPPSGATSSTPGYPTSLGYEQVKARLLIETAPNSNAYVELEGMTWTNVTEGLDDADFSATIEVPGFDLEKLFNADGTLKEHFASVLGGVNPDRRVRIQRPAGAAGRRVYFQGWPQVSQLKQTEKDQGMQFTCADEGQEWLRHSSQITGSYLRHNPAAAWSPTAPDHRLVRAIVPVFNPEGRPNRSAEAYEFRLENETTRTAKIHLWVMDGDPTAEHWTYLDALRTLLFFWVHAPVGPVSAREFLEDTRHFDQLRPSGSYPWAFVRRLLRRVQSGASVQSLSIDAALAYLCAMAGLHYHVAVRSAEGEGDTLNVDHFVRIIAAPEGAIDRVSWLCPNQGRPKVHDLPVQKPLSDLTNKTAARIAEYCRVQHFDLSIDQRAITELIVLGGFEEYEGSFLLRPGWTPDAAHHLDDLDVDANGAALTPAEILAARASAKARWAANFAVDYDEANQLIIASRYDRRHPDHAGVAEVFRRWICADDPNLNADLYGRKSGPWKAYRYRPYMPADPEMPEGPVGDHLWYEDWTYGAGLVRTVTQHWLARRRPFGDTIGRQSTASTDRAPIVRIHFGVPVVRATTGLNVAVGAIVYACGEGAYRLTANPAFACSDDSVCHLYADAAGIVKENIGDWPSGDHVTLARVTTANGAISGVEFYKRCGDVPAPDDPHWQDFTGDVSVLEDRGGVYFGANGLWNDACWRSDPANDVEGLAVQAMIDGHFWVQVTATIRGDDRLRQERVLNQSSFSRRRSQVVDLAFETFRVRDRRGGNSFLNARDTDEAEYEDRDDGVALVWHSEELAKQMGTYVIGGDMETWFADDSFAPGDAVSGCRGLGLSFAGWPYVQSRIQMGGDSPRTQLTLCDTRANPEVGGDE
jgi:hypothetical protein